MPSQHTGTFTVRDYSDETSAHTIHFGAITALSIAGFLTQFGAYRTALGNIIKGVIGKEQWVGDNTVLDNTSPAATDAQVELKFLLTYEGTTSKKKYRTEIPTPDTSKLIPGTDKVDLTDSEVAAYITAFEALAKSPDSDTEGVNVLDMRLVGRNN